MECPESSDRRIGNKTIKKRPKSNSKLSSNFRGWRARNERWFSPLERPQVKAFFLEKKRLRGRFFL
jgi:hypothetical protein